MPQARQTSRQKASAPRARSGSATKDQGLREQLTRYLDPREVVVLTRDRVQEALDDAVERGRMTRSDATELVAALQARQQKGPMVPTLLMPAVRNGFAGKEETRERLEDVVAQWREAGLPAEGVGGDPDPAVAGQGTWDPRNFDEGIVSTKPATGSGWTPEAG